MLKGQYVYCADFETYVPDNGEEKTWVWSAAIGKLWEEDVLILRSIEDFFDYIETCQKDSIIYFHNLEFDGKFIINYLLSSNRYKNMQTVDKDGNVIEHKKGKDLEDGEFTYIISSKNKWYTINCKHNGVMIEFRDSLKLLPMSLEKIGKSFCKKHQKSTMEYKGYRDSNTILTDEEIYYIKEDINVLREALELMYSQKHNKLTIGACCLSEYKNIVKHFEKDFWKKYFPNLEEVPTPDYIPDKNADQYVRHSYKGAWCYVKESVQNQVLYNGCTADVNSLYPSVMHSVLGTEYPIGKPYFFGVKFPYKLSILSIL